MHEFMHLSVNLFLMKMLEQFNGIVFAKCSTYFMCKVRYVSPFEEREKYASHEYCDFNQYQSKKE